MRKISVPVFQFDELEKTIQEKLIEEERQAQYTFDFAYESAVDDLVVLLQESGFLFDTKSASGWGGKTFEKPIVYIVEGDRDTPTGSSFAGTIPDVKAFLAKLKEILEENGYGKHGDHLRDHAVNAIDAILIAAESSEGSVRIALSNLNANYARVRIEQYRHSYHGRMEVEPMGDYDLFENAFIAHHPGFLFPDDDEDKKENIISEWAEGIVEDFGSAIANALSRVGFLYAHVLETEREYRTSDETIIEWLQEQGLLYLADGRWISSVDDQESAESAESVS